MTYNKVNLVPFLSEGFQKEPLLTRQPLNDLK